VKDRTISPVFVDERQVQRMANEARAALKDLYERLPPPPEPRTMPVDVDTELYWPLGEPSGSPSFGNFGSQRQTGDRLVPLGTCAPTLGGLVEDGCAVFWGAQATRGASGAVGFTGSSPPIGSLSAWVRLGDPGSATTRIVGGYFNAAGTLATMQLYVASDGTPAFSVQTSAGTRSVAGVTSQRMYPGSWHFLCGAYNGTGVALFLDGIDLYSGSFGAYAPLAWSLASAPSWRLGLPGSASSWCGALQDLRMHSTVRTVAWAHEAWRRGFNLLGGAT
jgi:hypothetical protein